MKNKIKKFFSICSILLLSASMAFLVYASETDDTDTDTTVTGSTTTEEDDDYEVVEVEENSYEISVSFTNYYISPVDVEITANKVLNDNSNTGITLEDGMFEFELYLDEELVSTAANDADGLITFDTLTFSEEGEHSIIIKEVAGTDEHITYDDTILLFTLTVELIDYEYVVTIN